MLDPKLIREKPETVRTGMRRKGADPAIVDLFLEVDASRRTLQSVTEDRQAELNAASKQLAAAPAAERDIMRAELRSLSDAIREQNVELSAIEKEWVDLIRQIPNLPADEVPEGKSDKDNVILKTVGQKKEFSFTPKTHDELALRHDLLDIEQAVAISGAKSYYLKNELVILEQAVLRWSLDILRGKGFTLMTVPHLALAEAFYGVGHFSTPADAEEGDAYKVERDGLFLIGTAEVGLVNYMAGKTVREADLPIRLAGISPAYRREAGTYGKESRGLYRVHQFNKVEMVSFTRPEDSEQEQKLLFAINEEMLQALGLSYQVVINCGADLGQPQALKWDIETWMPGLGKYGETHSCSNDTDYQARTLKIKYRVGDGQGKETAFVHTLNDTVMASPRILIPILENYQQEDGSIAIPEVLQKYTGFKTIGVSFK